MKQNIIVSLIVLVALGLGVAGFVMQLTCCANKSTDQYTQSNSDEKMCGPDKYCDRGECIEKGGTGAKCHLHEHCKGYCWEPGSGPKNCQPTRDVNTGCEEDEQCTGFCNYNTKKCNDLKLSDLDYGCNRDAQCEGWCHVKKGETEGVCKKLKIPNPD